MPFCINCGSRLTGIEKFCGSCGASVEPPLPEVSLHRSTSTMPVNATEVVAILPQVTKPKFGLADSYTIVFTESSAIFAKLTNQVLKDVVLKSQANSNAAGRNWIGKVSDQMKAFHNAHLRYFEMSPEVILAEDKDNFRLPHDSVLSLRLKTKFQGGDEDGPGDEYLEMEFSTSSGKYKFNCAYDSKETATLLARFYGQKIRR